jgi:uncharacterized protein (TIGR00369 family)
MTDEPKYALAPFFGEGRREFIDHIPHVRRLGMEVLYVGPHTARIKLPFREELIGDPIRRVVFGGVITTLLDHASGLAVSASLPEFRAIATLDLRIDYLRAAVPDRDLIGESTCYKVTHHVAFIRASAWEDSPDDPFATCHASFMLGANPAENAIARAIRKKDEEASS